MPGDIRVTLSCILVLILTLFTSRAASPPDPLQPASRVRTGLEVLLMERQELLRGKRVGIIANHTSCTAEGEWILDALSRIEGLTIGALFTPEHGLDLLDASTRERWKDVRRIDLHAGKRRPYPQELESLDAIVYDVQDVGCRFYTYTSTMLLAMDAAREAGLEFVVLDRPNPLGGTVVEGPVLLPEFRSFVGMIPIPIRYGLTAGELASLANGEGYLQSGGKAELCVVPMQGWSRAMYFDETGLPWIPPSPNLPNLESVLLYPGFCLLEGTNLSEGRGTMTPFTLMGAPWLDPAPLLAAAGPAGEAGISLAEAVYTPQSIPGMSEHPKYLGESVQGVKISVTDRERLRSFRLAVLLIAEAEKGNNRFGWTGNRYIDLLAGRPDLRETIERGRDLERALAAWDSEALAFRETSRKYFLYGD
jgi:uncharacterized protein YbbC (DUF1343 family)